MPHRPRVLVAAAGLVDPPAEGQHADWFRDHLEPLGAEVASVEPFRGDPLPDPAAYDGLIVSGSACGVRDEAPWMAALAQQTLAWAEQRPVLAVCFGHQLLGEALGGWVEPHADGPEWGTVSVHLDVRGRDDPLFAGLPATIRVQGLHGDHLVRPPAAPVTALASNAHTPVQAWSLGQNLRAVQFHPELRAPVLSRLMVERGWDPTAPVQPSEHGHQLLRNWLRRFVSRQPGRAGPPLPLQAPPAADTVAHDPVG